jgi:ribosomal protein S18 acetylase RimI-like enzyme
MPNIIIRKLSETDLKPLANLYKQFWGEESDVEKMKQRFMKTRDNQKYIILSAIYNGALAGSIMGIECDELYGECNPFLVIENLVVDKQYRKKGIGKALMQELEKYAKERNCTQILFITEANRKEAILFYESLGYDSNTHAGFKKSIKK